jgi:hypothetical protein
MGVDEVSELGMLSIEHINDVTRATTSDYDGVIAEMNARAQAEMREVNLEDRLLAQERLYAEHDPQKAAELYRRFVDNGTWMVPTLTVNRQWSQLLPNAQYNHALNSEYLQYVSSQTLSYWDSEAVVTSAGPNLSLYITRLWQNKSVLLAGMLAEGVNIVAGTDSGATYVFHGSSMHDELELLVQAGLSESQALKAATYNGAAMAGRLDEFGTIERGKTADLVLLNANPLEDIRNSREIESVIFNGQLRDRAALDAMLLRVKSDSGN